MKTLLLVLLAVAGSILAQTGTPPPPPLATELAPLATKHKADFATVETQKKTAVGRAQHDYLAALDFADKAATSAGDLKGVVAIGKERDLAKTKPDLALSFPADLPATLRPARKVYLDAIDSANADAKKREDQIDSDYLRTLGMLDSHAAANPALAKQIAAEKAEIIRRATAATATTTAAPTTTAPPASPGKPATSTAGVTTAATPAPVLGEKLVNGKFEEVDADDLPTGWRLCGVGKDGVVPDGVSIKAIKENGVSFLRMTFDGRYHNCGVVEELAIPNRARTALFKVWYRGNVTGRANPNDRRGWPNVELKFFDEKGAFIGHDLTELENVTHQASYKTLEKTAAIPNGAVKAGYYLWNGNTNGVFDFEHAEVTFK